MIAQYKRLTLWSVIFLIVIAGLFAAFWPRPVFVDLTRVELGPMMLTVGDEGVTRVIDVYEVSAPITGRLRRIEAEPGDEVLAGQSLIAEIEPTEPQLLDPRTEAEARALLSAAESAAAQAEAEVARARAELKFAESEHERYRELAARGTVSTRDLEAAARALESSMAALGVVQANQQVREFELERARALLMPPDAVQALRARCACVKIHSPVDGRVLRILRESEGFVQAGEGLVAVGNPERLEIVVDLLSIDAVKISPGDSALIENWGGGNPLRARVRRVEPFGFTKVSALGIEEQRVNVVLDLVSPREDWQALGHGYQVDVRVVLWESPEVLKVPLTALFRDEEQWMIFVNEKGRARQKPVEIGHSNAMDAQVLAGLGAGEWIVLYPGEQVLDGARIAARQEQ